MGATSSSKTQAVPENNTRINFSEIGGDEDDEDESGMNNILGIVVIFISLFFVS